MTNKEIFDTVVVLCDNRFKVTNGNGNQTTYVCNYPLYKIIEVLEILKKYKVNIWAIDEYSKVNNYNAFREPSRHLNEEQFKLIKEWLENDK